MNECPKHGLLTDATGFVNTRGTRCCRPCSREASRKYAAKYPERVHATQRRQRPMQTERLRGWKRRYPERKRACTAVERALHKGLIVRPATCQRCGKPCKPEAHHADYAKPLEIIWACQPCHGELDVQRRIADMACNGTHGNGWNGKDRRRSTRQ